MPDITTTTPPSLTEQAQQLVEQWLNEPSVRTFIRFTKNDQQAELLLNSIASFAAEAATQAIEPIRSERNKTVAMLRRLLAEARHERDQAATQGQVVGIERVAQVLDALAKKNEDEFNAPPSAANAFSPVMIDTPAGYSIWHDMNQFKRLAADVRALSPDPSYLDRVRNEAATAAQKPAMIAESEGYRRGYQAALEQAARNRPKIICLCGSTRFVQTWIDEYQRLSDEGNIVLTVARMPPRPNLQHEQPELKQKLDGLHFHKIALADEVFILNVGGYIGESTAREIEHAMSLNKTIRWLEQR